VTVSEPAWEAAASALVGAGTVCMVGHVGPDGDALGAMIGLSLAARAAGKTAVASFGEPFVLGDEFSFLDQSVLVPSSQIPGDIDLTVVCDTGVMERLGSAGVAVHNADRVLVIDHHASGGDVDGIMVVDPSAAATTQLAYKLLRRVGWPITVDAATALYTGLVTDTGRFMYSSTDGEVHRIAAELLDAGVLPAVVGQHLYEQRPFGYFAVVARVLARAELDEESGLVWSIVNGDDLAAAEIGWEDVDDLIDLVRLAEEADTALLLKEMKPGTVRGSLRSRGAVDVSAIAATFGGGGHHNAAGFTADANTDEIVADIAKQLR
jgi:bifunctional oligoribonuclease and PAP phosphatase NrnA